MQANRSHGVLGRVLFPLALLFASTQAGTAQGPLSPSSIDEHHVYVDPRRGDDVQGDGSEGRPYRTLFRALSPRTGWAGIEGLPGYPPVIDRFYTLVPFDAEGDGDLDILVASSPAFYFEHRNRQGLAPIARVPGSINWPTYRELSGSATWDFDGDGDDDIVAFVFEPSSTTTTMPIRIVENSLVAGRPSFWNERVPTYLGQEIRHEFGVTGDVADLDGDGRMELALPQRASNPWSRGPVSVRVYRKLGAIGLPYEFDSYIDIDVSMVPDLRNTIGLRTTLRAADFDGDGDADLAIGIAEGLYLFDNRGPLGILSRGRVASGIGALGHAQDIDGDGILDWGIPGLHWAKGAIGSHWTAQLQGSWSLNREADFPVHHLVVHAAPGIYSAASGESFPLVLKPGASIRGSGMGRTVLRPALDETGFVLQRAPDPLRLSRELALPVGLSDLTIESGGVGIHMHGFQLFRSARPGRVERVEFRGLDYGLVVRASTDVELRNCIFDGCLTRGVWFIDYTSSTPRPGYYQIGFFDCLFRRNGIGLETGQVLPPWGIQRSQFLDNRIAGVVVDAVQLDPALEFRSSVFARNGIGIAIANTVGTNVPEVLRVRGCTLLDNGVGIGPLQPTPFDGITVEVTNSILWNQGSDVGPGLPNVSISSSTVRQSGYAGQNGNISVAPDLLDPVNDDFHLPPGSLLVDRGDRARADATDLDGSRRVLGSAPDLGADEASRADLFLVSAARVGAPLRGRVLGAAASSAIALAGLPRIPAVSISVGELWIDVASSSFSIFGPYALDSRGVGAWQLAIPADPQLFGLMLVLQGLSPAFGSSELRLSEPRYVELR